MNKQESNDEPLDRSETTDRSTFNINYSGNDPQSLETSVDKVKEKELAHRKLVRTEDHEDRLEWVLRWQQSLILAFLAFCLLAAMIASGWAIHIELWGGDEAQTKRAHHIFEILMDAGIAALVGFFAIKQFEK